MRFLRFDLKSDRRQRVIYDRFCLASSLWNPFVENCQKAYVPGPYISIDEQYFHVKLGADLFNTSRITRISLESSSG